MVVNLPCHAPEMILFRWATSFRGFLQMFLDQKMQSQPPALPGLVNVNKKLWEITMLFMGKLTKYISMAIFQFAFCMFTRGYLKMQPTSTTSTST